MCIRDRHITEMTRQNLEFYAEQLTVNMDNMVESMKQVTDYIVSDPDMLSAIQAMPRYHETGADQERKKQGEVITSGSVSYTHLDVYKRQGCTPAYYRKMKRESHTP